MQLKTPPGHKYGTPILRFTNINVPAEYVLPTCNGQEKEHSGAEAYRWTFLDDRDRT